MATIVGTDGNDVLRGSDGDDVIAALGGADVVQGLGGDDTICGGDGKDVLQGGSGDDRLSGGTGTDVAIGGGGTDACAAETVRCEGRIGLGAEEPYIELANTTYRCAAGECWGTITAGNLGANALVLILRFPGSTVVTTLNADANGDIAAGTPLNLSCGVYDGDAQSYAVGGRVSTPLPNLNPGC